MIDYAKENGAKVKEFTVDGVKKVTITYNGKAVTYKINSGIADKLKLDEKFGWNQPSTNSSSSSNKTSSNVYSGSTISQSFGGANGHLGIDIATTGDIKAAFSGTVVGVDSGGKNGNMVTIDHGNNTYSHYSHASSIIVSKGDTVTVGQKLGTAGKTGNSDGVHIHLGFYTNGAGPKTSPAGYYTDDSNNKANTNLKDSASAFGATFYDPQKVLNQGLSFIGK